MYRERDGSFKEYTKVVVSTYSLVATGLDGLKVANYQNQYAATGNHALLAQAAGRITRRGQPLPTFVFSFQSTDQAVDNATVAVRDRRKAHVGTDGIMKTVSQLMEAPA